MKTKTMLCCLPFLFACQPPDAPTDPNRAIDDLVKEFGYIGFQNPLEHATTGTLIGGRPDAVSFVGNANDCFHHEVIPRYEDTSEYSKVYNYEFKGSLGFLLSGNSILSAGLALSRDITVEIRLSGLVTEYMSSIDITDWYIDGMSNTCRRYLNDVGFIVQALKAEELTISFKRLGGNSIGLDLDNVTDYIQFRTGVDWQIQDETSIVISTPKYIGYQIGRLRLEDDDRSLWRAMSVQDGRYFFERIALFDDYDMGVESTNSSIKKSFGVDEHAIFVD
jgi:hypothetical protein